MRKALILSALPEEVIQVELKQRPGAAMTRVAASEDSVSVDPRHYKVEFQNDRGTETGRSRTPSFDCSK
jgi:hypothetical protein